MQVMGEFEDDYGAVKALASNTGGCIESPHSLGEQSALKIPSCTEEEFSVEAMDAAKLVILRLRASQKQVLWEALKAIIMQRPTE